MFAPNQIDAYKIGHINQYPNNTTYIYSNFTARSGKLSNVPNSKGIFFIGLQHLGKEYLIEEWNETFFNKPKDEVVKKYKRRVSNMLGYDVNVDHIANLHDLGYLPISIKALPEGSFIKYKVPMLTIQNTLPDYYWLTNYIESVLSSELFLPCNSATSFMAFRMTSLEFSNRTCNDNSFVPYQNHDFSMRGMPTRHAAAISGFASLACGSYGTDTVSAVDLAEDYYNANSDEEIVGTSVNASEHSVVCAGGSDDEVETLRRLLIEVYPKGIFSYVSDTWDFWRLVTKHLVTLKDLILERDGKLVIRPDSGDPVDIICGIPDHEEICQQKGLIECLWDIFGGTLNSKGFKVLNPKIGAIYGDSITIDRQRRILTLLESKGFASNNIIFGIGLK